MNMHTPLRVPLRVRHTLRRRLVQVVRVEQLSPRMRRITFGGAELDGFTTLAPDDHVKLFFPAPGQDKPDLPVFGPDGPVYAEGATRPAVRDYTPRRFDPETRELAIEFVLHGDGPAASWAAQAAPGQWIGIGGPKGSILSPEGFGTYLLAGDETALPAIARALEEMPAGQRVHALIEVADREEERHLPTAANARITWLHRGETPAEASPLLEQALRALALPPDDTYAWLAGEIGVMRQLRTYLVEQAGLARSQVRAAGYWRAGEADSGGRLDG
ncbi:siderophore-interacting protein [Acidisphaera sp. L21]|uniref:siderophore-interacting protein n=1 Tax=Acidisphaera sp. L21 TaxID=1641851 RepID=UPI0020B136A2|nr:siderophore-interacting protein [Acidisphaera sp. L21]